MVHFHHLHPECSNVLSSVVSSGRDESSNLRYTTHYMRYIAADEGSFNLAQELLHDVSAAPSFISLLHHISFMRGRNGITRYFSDLQFQLKYVLK